MRGAYGFFGTIEGIEAKTDVVMLQQKIEGSRQSCCSAATSGACSFSALMDPHFNTS